MEKITKDSEIGKWLIAHCQYVCGYQTAVKRDDFRINLYDVSVTEELGKELTALRGFKTE